MSTIIKILPILLVHNKGSWVEGHMIDLAWSGKENIRKKGKFPVGTNRKGVNNVYGDVSYSKGQTGFSLLYPSQKEYANLEDYDTAFDKHQNQSDKKNVTSIPLSRKLSDFFGKKKPSASKSEPQDPSESGTDVVSRGRSFSGTS